MNDISKQEIKEKSILAKKGSVVLISSLLAIILSIFGIVLTALRIDSSSISGSIGATLVIGCVIIFLYSIIMLCGLRILNPNEALVLTLFGKYYGTIIGGGFFFVNPFSVSINPAVKSKTTFTQNSVTVAESKKISLKAMTLNNEKQKVNDLDGNPIEIGVIVIWQITNAASAVFNVDNYKSFISTQCDSAIRHVARSYPYDVSSSGDEQSLRGSSSEVADVLKNELQKRTKIAGIEIVEARISHLAYAPEIAAAMLQRQQASAVIAARQKIVEGAVGMVEMALKNLSEKKIVQLDDERKAQMVSNLLVVLCANKETQPIVNSGSIY